MFKIKKPLVSIVIPCYNSRNLVGNCLASIFKTPYPYLEIIIVDDCSLDGTYEFLKRKYGKNTKVKVVRNERNSGPSHTRNHGIFLARGKYVAFIETDMEVQPNWLGPLVSRIERDEKLAAVQSKVLDLKNKNLIQAAGVLYDPHTFWVVGLGCGFPKESIKKSREVGIGAVGSLVRKDVIDKIGGFDEALVHNIDDVDFGWRIWLSGYSIVTVPESVTYHWTAKPIITRAKVTPSVSSEFHFHKTLRIFIKNYELTNIFRYTPWLIFAFLVRVFKNLLEGNTKPLVGFSKAFIWNIKTFPDTISERKKIQKLRRRSDFYILKKIGLKGNFFEVYFGQIRPTLKRAMMVFRQDV